MPKRFKLKFGGAAQNVVIEESNNTMLYLGLCLLCACFIFIGGGIGYLTLPKCDDKDESGIYETTCDNLYKNNSNVCFGECKKEDCCDELKCVSPERNELRSMVVLPESETEHIGGVYNAINDFDSSGNLKSDKKPSITCNADDGWGPDFNIKRCTAENNKWSIECEDSIEKKCINDEFNGVRFEDPHRRLRTPNCENINISESGEGVGGWFEGLYNRATESDDHQRNICLSHYSLSSGSKGYFCDFDDSGINSCTTSTTECRGPS